MAFSGIIGLFLDLICRCGNRDRVPLEQCVEQPVVDVDIAAAVVDTVQIRHGKAGRVRG